MPDYSNPTSEDEAEVTELLKVINREKDAYEQREIEIVPSLYFSQYKTIKKIYFYHNSKFITGETDDEDDRKYFYNISRNPCGVMTKSIDFDTKDIRLYTADGGDTNVTWYMERDLKFWMKDQNFGKTLNRIFEELPIYGSVVLKEVNKKLKFVDLRNFIVEQQADSLSQANYIIEKHDYTVPEYKKIAKKMGWKHTEEVIEKFYKMRGMTHIRVYERYGMVKQKEEHIYKRVFYADVGINSVNQITGTTVPYTGFLLREDDWDTEDLPYWEFHLKKVPGRWLGVGYVETLFEPQIRQNEIANIVSKITYFAGLNLWQTTDQSEISNLLTEAPNGQVLTADAEIKKVDVSVQNLPYFNEEFQKWSKNVNDLTMIQDFSGVKSKQVIENLQAMMKSYFAIIQQNVALDVVEMIYDVIIPDFLDNASDEHIVRIVGQDLDKLHEIMIANETNRKILVAIFKGNIPTSDEITLMKSIVSSEITAHQERHILLPADFYKDAKFKVNIDITGESRDNRAWAQTMMAAIQAITVDPTILSDPNKKKFFMWWLESQGVSPGDINFTMTQQQNMIQGAQEAQAQNKGAGGGVSKPLPAQSRPQPLQAVAQVNNG